MNSERFKILSALVKENLRKIKRPLQHIPALYECRQVQVAKYYTANRFLPFALRLLIIFLPCLVDIRFKKPCFLARLILLG